MTHQLDRQWVGRGRRGDKTGRKLLGDSFKRRPLAGVSSPAEQQSEVGQSPEVFSGWSQDRVDDLRSEVGGANP